MMNSGDRLRSDDVVSFFEKSLRKQGLKSVEVIHTTQEFYDEFYVRKRVGDEKLVYKTTYDFEKLGSSTSEMQKLLALEAEKIAQKFNKKLTTTVTFNNRRIEICPHDGGWAKCNVCDTKINAPTAQIAFTEACELSDPYPIDRDVSAQWANMSDNEQVLFKAYLAGILREQCDTTCPNSKYHRKI